MTLKKGKLIKKKKVKKPQTPQGKGEASVSGHMPVPESDDNALEAAQESGLYLEADSEDPETLGVGREINEAERKLIEHPRHQKKMPKKRNWRPKKITEIKEEDE